ncbi:hypothetical protein [Novosphingobium sp. Leaf2]|uniref:hypothetical protein n=1 Tax=Novosphingobium sp. Leaf2 TaxID=1735670 RepID=UPI0006FF5659|nr:hypothetical protein [Novosphingobium sp. Leaf2]KQM19654.1 hypothetical protein ASE49_05450 [Novosphingobium sp. Leaf2]
MNVKILALALAGTTLSLSACATDGYGGYGYSSVGWGTPYAYDGYYDGFYGPIYDGYWGRDNYFYYRNRDGDRRFRRADRNHFMRQAPMGQNRYQPMRGQFRPQQGMHMPQFGGGRGGPGSHRGHR